jgi:ubiquinone/menaquinone biosynthesis C-methylase UbiE
MPIANRTANESDGSTDLAQYIAENSLDPDKTRSLIHVYAEFDRKLYDYFRDATPNTGAVMRSALQDPRNSPTTRVKAASLTWDRENETLAQAEGRIHDGFADLVQRADQRISIINDLFPNAIPRVANAQIMEIGGGVGYIMEALGRHLDHANTDGWRIFDLDIAEHMMAKAKLRLGDDSRFGFIHYDGMNVPSSAQSFDFIYSVAALQHVPKEYVHSLFYEIKRLLKPGAFSVLELLSYNHILHLNSIGHRWKDYVDTQMGKGGDYWLWLYSQEELEMVLRHGVGFGHVSIKAHGTLLYACVGDSI